MGEITLILERARAGDVNAPDELLTAVYEELRHVARAKWSRQPPGQTLQPTSLVHDAWLRLTSGQQYPWESRRHFYAAAAQAMRHILIERARKKQRLRHGGDLDRVPLEEFEIAAPAEDERLLQVNDALDEFAREAPEKAEVVSLRFFAGLNEREIAETLGLSLRTVERYWAYAKVWLFERISQLPK